MFKIKKRTKQKVKKGAKMTPVGERLDSCLQFIERASKRLQLCEADLAQVLQKKSRLEDELAQARRNLEVLHPRQQPHLLRLRTPTEKWSNSERRLQS